MVIFPGLAPEARTPLLSLPELTQTSEWVQEGAGSPHLSCFVSAKIPQCLHFWPDSRSLVTGSTSICTLPRKWQDTFNSVVICMAEAQP